MLSIDADHAEEAACRIEHAAPPMVISRMIEFIKFLQVCPRGGDSLLQGFADYAIKGTSRSDCTDCIASCADDSGDSDAADKAQEQS